MNYISKSDTLTVYQDYSVDVKCSGCGKIEHLDKDHKQAQRLSQFEDAAKDYVCLACWKVNKDSEKSDADKRRQEQISWGQALNCAIACLTDSEKHSMFRPLGEDEHKDIFDMIDAKIDFLQTHFYRKLIKRSEETKTDLPF